MMNLLKKLTKQRVKSVKVTLDLPNENGEVLPASFEVFYKTRTTAEAKKEQELFEDRQKQGRVVFISDLLINRITKLVSISGEEISVTQELLDGMDISNVILIQNAINTDGKTEDK